MRQWAILAFATWGGFLLAWGHVLLHVAQVPHGF